tara:strand:+ start:7641 stop:7781 length:141 start_codon:yes stop_codon:yes gene_type:complete
MFALLHEYRLKDGSVETWIYHVTEVCFRPKKPFDGSPSDTKDRWLI